MKNGIKELPSLKQKFKDLEELNLGFNFITNPQKLILLWSLKKLSLASNDLEEIPHEF